METGTAVPIMEEKFIRLDGTVIDVELRSAPLLYQGKMAMQAVVSDITERKQAEEKMRHLNLVLRAIRNVNQLVARGVGRDTLLKGVCENFVKTRGYHNAWIALLDESGKLVTVAEAGVGQAFPQVIEQLKRGKLPGCGRKALKKSGTVVIENPSSACTGCPLAKDYSNRGAMSVCLAYGGKVYGFMVVSAPLDFISQKEEMELFEEVAGDIAFALHSVEQEEERKKTEEALSRSEQNFHDSLETSPLGIRIFNTDGKTLYANRAMLDIWGYSSIEELEAVPRKQRYTPDSYDEHRERVDKRKRGEPVPLNYEISIVRSDGQVRHLSASRGELLWNGESQFQVVYQDITERKKAEEALADEAMRRRILMEQSRDGISILDEDSKLVEANHRFAEMLGYTPEELKDLHTWDWDTQWTRDELLDIGRGVDEAGALLETRHRRKDGTVFDVELSVNSIVVVGKKLLFCVSRDVTERKKAEEVMRHLNLVLRAIRNVNQLIARGADRDTLLKGVCENFVNTRGYHNAWIALLDESGELVAAAEAGLGEAFSEMIKRLKLGKLPDCGQKTLKKSGVVVFEDPPSVCTDCPLAKNYSGRGGMSIRLEYGDKVYGIMTVSAPLDFLGQKEEDALFEEVAGDIAFALHGMEQEQERSRAEEALRDSEERYRRLIETAYEGVWILDDEGRTTFVNARMAEMLGYNADEMIDKSLFLFMDEEWKAVAEEKLDRRRAGIVEQYEFKFRRKDGSDLWTTIAASPVSDKDGRYVGSLRMITDITEHKQAEEALRRSEQNFHDSLENSPYGVRVLGDDGKTLYTNRALLDMWGYGSAEELEAVPREQRYTPESYADYLERSEKRKLGEPAPYSYETSIVRSDGQIRVLSASRRELLWNGEKRFQLVYQDITERKQAELALQNSEQKHHSLVEDTSVGIASVDLVGNLTFVNRAVCNLSGYAESKMLGKPFADFLYPDDVQPVIDLFLGAAADQRDSVDVEFRVIDRKGRIIHLHASVTRVKQENETVGFNTIMTDITDRKRMEEELRTSRDYLNRLLNSMVEVLMVVDTDYNIIDINRSFSQYYAGKRKDIIGRKCYEVLHKLSKPCSTEQRRCPLRTVLKTGKPFYAEHVYKTVDGQEFVFEVSMFPLVDSAGNIEALVEMQHDVTESKRAEEEKSQLEQKAQVASRLASVGEMAAGIAHEINNPLTSVIGYSQLLSDRDDIAEDVRMDLKAIDEGAQRVAGIIKRLLTFARQTRPERTLANVNELITNTVDLRAYHLKTNNIKVITELATDLPVTTADPAQLQQVFLNIIVNAETAMKLARGKGKLLIKTEEVNGAMRISFKDNGPGIDKENLARIFDPFFTTREVGQGTGLGLSICHGIIAEHKGRIWAESEMGKGSTFIVELPVVIESGRLEIVEPADERPQKVHRARILVVDDEPSTLEFLSRLLTNEGHEVDTVTNAAEAFEMVKNKRYSLILLDIKMPGASGIELYGRMQKIAQSFAERVIFITGDIMGTDTEAFLSRTKAPYITKPFDVNQLKKEIEHFLTGNQ
jgi:PAS domain S-box-containing protein